MLIASGGIVGLRWFWGESFKTIFVSPLRRLVLKGFERTPCGRLTDRHECELAGSLRELQCGGLMKKERVGVRSVKVTAQRTTAPKNAPVP